MCHKARLFCCFAAFFTSLGARQIRAQQEVYHPGETYDSLQAGQDAYGDAEAQRRALIGRQIMIEDQIVQQNTWADPQDKYRPVRPQSFGPVLPKANGGPTLADVYAYPPSDGGPVYYGGTPAPPATYRTGSYAAPVPVFQPWPRVPNDIWGTPYYGYVRQPIGHVKIWTGRLSYIYKPIYASPPVERPSAYAASPRPAVALSQRPPAWTGLSGGGGHSPGAAMNSAPPPPPPPKPMQPAPDGPVPAPGDRPGGNPGQTVVPNRVGQEI